jgi:DNA repair and recombination protein RAD54 and RAD54-like protein
VCVCVCVCVCLDYSESSPKTPMKIRKFDQEDYDVLIISYDQLKIYCEEIAKIRAIDLLIADEGHRLKVCAV